MKKILFKQIFLIALSVCGFCHAQESYMSDFYKGNLVEKKQVVESSSAAGDSSIAIAALDFSISAYDALSSDTDFIN
ncbi:MAG: hypothetical protein SOV76_07840, partial [Treponema succinifaciens]